MLELAVVNKVPLLYLDRLNEAGRLVRFRETYNRLKTRRAKALRSLARATAILGDEGVDHAVFKTLKPYPFVPGDIDILVQGGKQAYRRAVRALLLAEYAPCVKGILGRFPLASGEDLDRAIRRLTSPTYGISHVSPTGIDLEDPESGTLIDLQWEFGMSYLVFIDQRSLAWEHCSMPEQQGEVPALRQDLDCGIVILHSAMEQMFLLSDFYALVYQLASGGQRDANSILEFLQHNKGIGSLRAFMRISARLCNQAFGTIPPQILYLLELVDSGAARQLRDSPVAVPYRYSLLTISSLLVEKLGDPVFRRSFIIQTMHMLDPRLALQVLRHVLLYRTRSTYLKDPPPTVPESSTPPS